jgi:hypothetical protein
VDIEPALLVWEALTYKLIGSIEFEESPPEIAFLISLVGGLLYLLFITNQMIGHIDLSMNLSYSTTGRTLTSFCMSRMEIEIKLTFDWELWHLCN